MSAASAGTGTSMYSLEMAVRMVSTMVEGLLPLRWLQAAGGDWHCCGQKLAAGCGVFVLERVALAAGSSCLVTAHF